jgi:ParB family chromosome partitioning protein
MSKLAKLLAEKSAQDQEKLKNDYLGSNSRDIFVTGANTYVQIALENIKPNKFQPRMVFDELELQSLANSIKELGLLQPIIVRSSGESNQYEIISGERRYRAFQLLEKSYIDCIVMDATDEKNSLLALAENINREDLTDYEIAKSVIAFKNGFPNKSEYANTLGISRQDLYRLLSFEKLPLEIQQRLDNSPTLLTAKTAEQIGQFIKNNDIASEKMVEILNEVLDLVLTEGLKQNGILNEIEIRVKGNKGNNIKNGNRTVKIFAIDGKKVGQIKKNLNKTTIEFNNDILDQHQQAIEKFFETLISS